MSQENVEIVRRAYQAGAERGPSAVPDFFHQEAEWHPPREDPDTTPRRGHKAIIRYLDQWLDAWEDFRIEPEALLDAGDKVVALVRITGRGRGSGAEFPELSFTHVFTLREGQIVRVELSYDRDEALEAAGLSE